jgi:hypothetical protein
MREGGELVLGEPWKALKQLLHLVTWTGEGYRVAEQRVLSTCRHKAEAFLDHLIPPKLSNDYAGRKSPKVKTVDARLLPVLTHAETTPQD